MPDATYNAFSDRSEWSRLRLKDFGDYSEMVEHVNERETGFGDYEGEWFFCDDGSLTVYYGTYGNGHSPGASCYTWAAVHDDKSEYEKLCHLFNIQPAYIE